MQAEIVVPPLQRVSAKAIQIKPGASGDEHAPLSAELVKDSLEEVAPASVFVQFVEHPHLAVRQLALENALALGGDIPVQISRRIGEERLREGGFPNLSRSTEEDHFLVKIGCDLGFQISAHAQ